MKTKQTFIAASIVALLAFSTGVQVQAQEDTFHAGVCDLIDALCSSVENSPFNWLGGAVSFCRSMERDTGCRNGRVVQKRAKNDINDQLKRLEWFQNNYRKG